MAEFSLSFWPSSRDLVLPKSVARRRRRREAARKARQSKEQNTPPVKPHSAEGLDPEVQPPGQGNHNLGEHVHIDFDLLAGPAQPQTRRPAGTSRPKPEPGTPRSLRARGSHGESLTPFDLQREAHHTEVFELQARGSVSIGAEPVLPPMGAETIPLITVPPATRGSDVNYQPTPSSLSPPLPRATTFPARTLSHKPPFGSQKRTCRSQERPSSHSFKPAEHSGKSSSTKPPSHRNRSSSQPPAHRPTSKDRATPQPQPDRPGRVATGAPFSRGRSGERTTTPIPPLPDRPMSQPPGTSGKSKNTLPRQRPYRSRSPHRVVTISDKPIPRKKRKRKLATDSPHIPLPLPDRALPTRSMSPARQRTPPESGKLEPTHEPREDNEKRNPFLLIASKIPLKPNKPPTPSTSSRSASLLFLPRTVRLHCHTPPDPDQAAQGTTHTTRDPWLEGQGQASERMARGRSPRKPALSLSRESSRSRRKFAFHGGSQADPYGLDSFGVRCDSDPRLRAGSDSWGGPLGLPDVPDPTRRPTGVSHKSGSIGGIYNPPAHSDLEDDLEGSRGQEGSLAEFQALVKTQDGPSSREGSPVPMRRSRRTSSQLDRTDTPPTTAQPGTGTLTRASKTDHAASESGEPSRSHAPSRASSGPVGQPRPRSQPPPDTRAKSQKGGRYHRWARRSALARSQSRSPSRPRGLSNRAPNDPAPEARPPDSSAQKSHDDPPGTKEKNPPPSQVEKRSGTTPEASPSRPHRSTKRWWRSGSFGKSPEDAPLVSAWAEKRSGDDPEPDVPPHVSITSHEQGDERPRRKQPISTTATTSLLAVRQGESLATTTTSGTPTHHSHAPVGRFDPKLSSHSTHPSSKHTPRCSHSTTSEQPTTSGTHPILTDDAHTPGSQRALRQPGVLGDHPKKKLTSSRPTLTEKTMADAGVDPQELELEFGRANPEEHDEPFKVDPGGQSAKTRGIPAQAATKRLPPVSLATVQVPMHHKTSP